MEINSTNPKANPYLQGIAEGETLKVGREEKTHAASAMWGDMPVIDEGAALDEIYAFAPEFGQTDDENIQRKRALKNFERVAANVNSNSSSDTGAAAYSYLTPEAAATLLAEMAIEFSLRERREAREFARQERQTRIGLLKEAAHTFKEEAKNLRMAAGTQLALGVVSGAISVGAGSAGIHYGAKAAAASKKASSIDVNAPPSQTKVGSTSTGPKDGTSPVTTQKDVTPKSATAEESRSSKELRKIKEESDAESVGTASSRSDGGEDPDAVPDPVKTPLQQRDELKAQAAEWDAKSRSVPIIGQGASQFVHSVAGSADTFFAAERKLMEADRALYSADAEYADANDKESQDFAQRMQEHSANMLDFLRRHLEAQIIRIRA